MKKLVFTCILWLFIYRSFAQFVYAPGYFIDNNQEITECFIREENWVENSKKFSYRLSESGEVLTGNIDRIREFGINNSYKYIRATVQIDRSPDLAKNLSYERNPLWSKETVFLKVLVEGKAGLYYFEDPDIRRFFYRLDNDTITALVYKKYLKEPDKITSQFEKSTDIYYNRYFQQQLNLYVNCGDQLVSAFEKLRYDFSSLTDYFIKYNECKGVKPIYVPKTRQKIRVHFKITPGLAFAPISIDYYSGTYEDMSLGTPVGYRLGLETEVLLPFNKKKWSLFFEPNYRSFQGEANSRVSLFDNTPLNIKYSYTALQIHLGVRHYLHLNKKNSFFINGGFVYDFVLGDSKIDFDIVRPDQTFRNTASAALGLAYSFKNFMSIEGRYVMKHNLLVKRGDNVNAPASFADIILGIKF